MGIVIPGRTGAENHCIVIKSSQMYPADYPPVVIPGCVQSAQTRNPATIGARLPDVQLQIWGTRGAFRRAAQSADRWRTPIRANWRVGE